MKTIEEQGGYIYPQSYEDGLRTRYHWHGITLRDNIAIAAMQGLIAHYGVASDDMNHMLHANEAYKQADAMLKAREL